MLCTRAPVTCSLPSSDRAGNNVLAILAALHFGNTQGLIEIHPDIGFVHEAQNGHNYYESTEGYYGKMSYY